MCRGPRDTPLANRDSVPRRQNHVYQRYLCQLFENLARLISQAGCCRHLAQCLPENVCKETNQNVCLHTICPLMPDRPDLQIRFLDPECRLCFRQLDVSTPQLLRRPIRHVAPQHVTAFTQTGPLPPRLQLCPLDPCRSTFFLNVDLKQSRCARVLSHELSDPPGDHQRFLPAPAARGQWRA